MIDMLRTVEMVDLLKRLDGGSMMIKFNQRKNKGCAVSCRIHVNEEQIFLLVCSKSKDDYVSKAVWYNL